MSWSLSDDLSWILDNQIDPRTGPCRSGDFRIDLIHELGHWVVAQHVGLQIDGLGLYGLSYGQDGSIYVATGGGVAIASARPGHWEWVMASVAGVIAEKLENNESFMFEDPVELFSEAVFFHDLNAAKCYIACSGVDIDDARKVNAMLSKAIAEGTAIVRPLLPRLRDAVIQLENIVRSRRLDKLEIAWTGVHAALLAGGSPSEYE